MKENILILTLTVVIGACAPERKMTLSKAVPLEKEVRTEYVEVPSPRPLPGQLKPLPMMKTAPVPNQPAGAGNHVIQAIKGQGEKPEATRNNKQSKDSMFLAEEAASGLTIEGTLQSLAPVSGNNGPRNVVEDANKKASYGPEEEGFINSIMVYDYMEGALYQLFAAPQHISSIMLQPGEKLMSVASGDTVRWVINDIMSGAGDSQKVHVLVKPVKSELTTNILITTDRRVYNIEAHSDSETYMASLSWNYPKDALMRNVAIGQEELKKDEETVDSRVQLSLLHFSYAIEGKKHIPWKPERVFDDGLKTYIEFPPSMKAYEAPVLFIATRDNASQLVNYRKKGDFYIVDRLFDKAELRVGEKDQEVVVIQRTGRT